MSIEQDPPKKPTLPPKRLFHVERPNNLSALLIEAHGFYQDGGSLFFVTLVIEDVEGKPTVAQYTRRALKVWLEIEEVMTPVTVVH